MSRSRILPAALAMLASSALVAAALSTPALSTALAAPAAPRTPQTADRTGHADRPGAADLDVLFVGAHPDDEAFALSTYGQWGEHDDVRTGVITITRGEGGGNAVGPQEGPALGLIREAEERRAVARAGITDVYNLDEVDFFYTVSAALTQQVWGHDSTLSKVVRVVRETTPEVIVTMDPAPSPGNHGNHQYAGRMALEAYHAAADPHGLPPPAGRRGAEHLVGGQDPAGQRTRRRDRHRPRLPDAVRPRAADPGPVRRLGRRPVEPLGRHLGAGREGGAARVRQPGLGGLP